MDLISYVLERGHYDAKDMDDAFSEGVFDDYMDALDPYRRVLLQKDVDEFSKYRTELDDMIKAKDLTFFNLTYARYQERLKEAVEISEKDWKNLSISMLRKLLIPIMKTNVCQKQKRIKDRWRQQLKLSAIGNYYDHRDAQENPPAKTDDTIEAAEEAVAVVILTDKELEEKARTEVTDNMSDFLNLHSNLNAKTTLLDF